jgi:hypothetical protein
MSRHPFTEPGDRFNRALEEPEPGGVIVLPGCHNDLSVCGDVGTKECSKTHCARCEK